MKSYAVKVVYPVYLEIEAEDLAHANELALEKADDALQNSSVCPEVDTIEELDQNEIDCSG